jgi:hypothetical protein
MKTQLMNSIIILIDEIIISNDFSKLKELIKLLDHYREYLLTNNSIIKDFNSELNFINESLDVSYKIEELLKYYGDKST